jgi:transposase
MIFRSLIYLEGKSPMRTITIGVDLAKSLFAVCELDGGGRVSQRRELRREPFARWLAQVPAGTVVAMEACSGAHHWARRCQSHGLEPRLMAAQFVSPFRKRQSAKNDRNDAEAIATAARQGNMRFVPVKSIEQQARLAEHRIREGYKTEARAIGNRLRGVLAEFGVVVPQTDAALARALARLAELPVPATVQALLRELQLHGQQVQARLDSSGARIGSNAKTDARSWRLQQIIGVGALTADALVATIGDGQDFKNGRQFAAWLGLTPAQHSSGGKAKLGRITRRGDGYLRTLLIQGARSSLQRAQAVSRERATPEQIWIRELATRMPFGKVLVAVANKHARQAWAMLARGEDYDPQAWLRHPMVQRPASKKRTD